jgi:hypothetical protein
MPAFSGDFGSAADRFSYDELWLTVSSCAAALDGVSGGPSVVPDNGVASKELPSLPNNFSTSAKKRIKSASGMRGTAGGIGGGRGCGFTCMACRFGDPPQLAPSREGAVGG